MLRNNIAFGMFMAAIAGINSKIIIGMAGIAWYIVIPVKKKIFWMVKCRGDPFSCTMTFITTCWQQLMVIIIWLLVTGCTVVLSIPWIISWSNAPVNFQPELLWQLLQFVDNCLCKLSTGLLWQPAQLAKILWDSISCLKLLISNPGCIPLWSVWQEEHCWSESCWWNNNFTLLPVVSFPSKVSLPIADNLWHAIHLLFEIPEKAVWQDRHLLLRSWCLSVNSPGLSIAWGNR